MDMQLGNGFQTAHMFYFNQSVTTLWQVSHAWKFFSKRFELSDQVFIFKSMKNQLNDDKFVIVP